MARETLVQSQVKSYQRLKKWYLMLLCLVFSIIRYRSRVKWSNLGKEVVTSLTPRCSSYWKGSIQVTLDYGCQLILFMKYQLSYAFLHFLVYVQYFLNIKLKVKINNWSPDSMMANFLLYIYIHTHTHIIHSHLTFKSSSKRIFLGYVFVLYIDPWLSRHSEMHLCK